jgi:hypothetical protein
MSKFLKGLKGNLPELKTTPEVSATDIDALAEKLHAIENPVSANAAPKVQKTPRPKTASPKTPKKAARAMTATNAEPKELHRLTLDLPTDMMEKIKIQTKTNGQTVKGFILTLLNKHFSD